MNKRIGLSKLLGRQRSQVGWHMTLREHRDGTFGELNQKHMSVGKGHHFARSFKGHDRHWK